jgi:hypothetical protein
MHRQDLSQAAPYVRVIVCYQDIHRRIPLFGRKFDLNLRTGGRRN